MHYIGQEDLSRRSPPLIVAAKAGDLTTVQSLLDNQGADKDETTVLGRTGMLLGKVAWRSYNCSWSMVRTRRKPIIRI